MKKNFTILLFIICFSLFSSGEAQTLVAEASKSRVAVGEPFQISFSLNTSGTNLKIAHLNEFDIFQGPYNSSSTSVINGSVSQSYTLTYVVGAKKEGKLNIGPATVTVNGVTIQSNILIIDVTKGGTNNNNNNNNTPSSANNQNTTSEKPAGDNVYITTQVNKRKAYIGEEITVLYKIYTRVDITQFAVSKIPSVDGCYVQDGKISNAQVTENIDGVNYITGEIKKSYIIPQRTGKIIIDPLEAECVSRQQSNKRPRDIFEQFFGGGYEEVKYSIKSKPVTIDVLPLPEENKPADFTGTVGNYSLKASLSRNDLKTNDATNLTVVISGKGNIKLIEPLKINFPEEFETYDPKTSENISSDNGISGSKTFDYLIIPRHEGKYKIDKINFSYFDPEKKQYVTIPSPEFTINVAKGDDTPANVYSSRNKEDVKILANDIRYIKSATPLVEKNNYFFGSIMFYTGIVTPLLAFILFIIIRRKNIEDNKDSVVVKSRKATKLARKKLINAEQYLKTNNKERFYIEISQALYGYVGDKLNISVADLAKETISITLKEKRVSDDTIQQLLTTLNNCEYARYAPGAVSGDLNGIYNNTVELITKLENEIS
ncbi:MAG: BatD family protein [Bacteroidia bacterium]